MSWKRPVCSLTIPNRPVKGSTDYIWISDDVLTRAFQRFALSQTSKRHGSFTPGPLEARKRAAKRRMMNIARTGGTQPVHPGILSGLDGVMEPRGWSEDPQSSAPSTVEVKKELAPLPAWLADFDSPDPTLFQLVCPTSNTLSEAGLDHPRLLAEIDLSGPTSHQAVPKSFKVPVGGDLCNQRLIPTAAAHTSRESARRISKFVEGLKKCDTMDEICKLATRSKLDLRNSPTYSKLAFQHLLGKKSEIGSMLQFLGDPASKAHEARSLQDLVAGTIRSRTKGEVRTLAYWIRRKIQLGELSQEEISQISKTAYRLRALHGPEIDHMSSYLLAKICEGVITSSVVSVHALKAETLNVLLDCISDQRSFKRLQSFGVAIIKRVRPSQLREMRSGISTYLESFILCHQLSEAMKETEYNHSDAFSGVFSLLSAIPKDIAGSSIAQATLGLLERSLHPAMNDTQVLARLNLWWSTLYKSGIFHSVKGTVEWDLFERKLVAQRPEILSPYLRLLDDETSCDLLLRHWFGPKMLNEQGGYFHTMPIRFAVRFSVFNRKHPNSSPFLNMLRTVRMCFRPGAGIISHLFSLLRELDKSEMIIEIIKNQKKTGIHISDQAVAVEVAHHLKAKPRIAYRLFMSCSWLPMEQCPGLAETMIADPTLHPDIALYFRQRRQKIAIQTLPRYLDNATQVQQARMQLLNNMAIAYSQAQHLVPRRALRKVYECYLMIKRDCLGPLSSDITKSFVQAGVTRPLQEITWVSTMKLRWILSLVREVEGEKAADQVDQIVYKWRGDVIEKIRLRRLKEKQHS